MNSCLDVKTRMPLGFDGFDRTQFFKIACTGFSETSDRSKARSCDPRDPKQLTIGSAAVFSLHFDALCIIAFLGTCQWVFHTWF